jgi:hypothetical protein
MRRSPTWLVLFGVLLAAGCGDAVQLPVSEPLSDPVKAIRDDSLLGHWLLEKGPDDNAQVHVFVGKKTVSETPDSIMEAGIVSWSALENTVRITPFSFTVTRIGKESYVNLFYHSDKLNFSYPDWVKSEVKICSVLRYSCEGNTLRIWAQRRSEAKKIEDAGELNIVQGVITADSLIAYIERNGGDKLFSLPVGKYEKSERSGP